MAGGRARWRRRARQGGGPARRVPRRRRRRRGRRARGRPDARRGRLDPPPRGRRRPRRLRRARSRSRPATGARSSSPRPTASGTKVALARRAGRLDRPRDRPRGDVRRRRRLRRRGAALPARLRGRRAARAGRGRRRSSAGVAAGCRLAGCALLGGETAEHPGRHGARRPRPRGDLRRRRGARRPPRRTGGGGRRRARRPRRRRGLHSNGFSLVRRLVDEAGLDLEAPYAAVLRRHAPGVAGRAGGWPGLPLADVLLAPTRIYARALLAIRAAVRARRAGSRRPRDRPRHRRRPAGQRAPDRAGRARRRASIRRRWTMPSVMRLLGALGGLGDAELRATFNGGLGMVARRAARRPWTLRSPRRRSRGSRATVVGEVVPAAAAGGRRYVEVALMGGRIAVGVSGSGSNLRALAARIERGALDARDRPRLRRPRLRRRSTGPTEAGLETALIAGPRRAGARPRGPPPTRSWPRRSTPPEAEVVVLAGFMRLVGPALLGAFPGASSTSTRRSCRPSRAPTRSATRSRPGRP